MDDSKIIDLFFARNEDAIRHTHDTYGRKLFILADNIVRNDQDAEESVSDTYMRAWDTIPPRKPVRFFAYLAKICRNFALDKLDWKQAAKRSAEVVSLTQEMEMCIPDASRDRAMEAKELGRILDAFLRTLSEENQMVFLRRYWYVDTIAEIAVRYNPHGPYCDTITESSQRICYIDFPFFYTRQGGFALPCVFGNGVDTGSEEVCNAGIDGVRWNLR